MSSTESPNEAPASEPESTGDDVELGGTDEPQDDAVEPEAGDVDPQAAVTWYAPNKQCVGVSIAATVSTGATAGTPGTWTPANSEPPYDVSSMGGVTASPLTAWTTGQYVVCSSGARVNWTGTKWASGVHALEVESAA